MEKELNKMATVTAMVLAAYKKSLRLWQILAFVLLALCLLLTACIITLAPAKVGAANEYKAGIVSTAGVGAIMHCALKNKSTGKRDVYV